MKEHFWMKGRWRICLVREKVTFFTTTFAFECYHLHKLRNYSYLRYVFEFGFFEQTDASSVRDSFSSILMSLNKLVLILTFTLFIYFAN
jgi:hypothetical protein